MHVMTYAVSPFAFSVFYRIIAKGKRLKLIIFFTFCLNLAACPLSFAAEKVFLQLRWFHQFQFAGYYAAAEKGFYKAEGLDVAFIEGGPFNTVNAVLSGKADYGIFSSELVIEWIKEKPVVILGAFFQHSPSVVIARRSEGVMSPHDMIGKRLSMATGARTAEIQAMFINEGVSLDKIRLVQDKTGKRNFFDETISAFGGYISNEPFLFRQYDIPFTIIRPRSYGIDFYGDCLFTTKTEIDKRPDRADGMKRATVRGWQYALDHTNEIIELILNKYNSRKSREHLLYEADKTKELMAHDVVEIGHVNPDRWRFIAETYARLDMAPAEYDLTGFIYDPVQLKEENAKRLRNIIGAGSAAAGGVLLLFLLWILTLRKEVNVRTSKLTEEIAARIQTENLLRRSEETLRDITNKIPGMVYRFIQRPDGGYAVAYISERICDYSGKTPEQIMADPSALFEPIHPEDLETVRRRIAESAETLEEYRVEHRLFDPEGRIKWFHVRSTPKRENSGEIVWNGVSIDITDRKQAEQKLAEYSRSLEQMVEERTRKLKEAQAKLLAEERMAVLANIAGSLSHEIRNPLAAIDTSVYLIKMKLDDPDEKVTVYLERISSNVKKATAIIESLLNLTQTEKPKTERRSLSDLVSDILSGADIPIAITIMTRYPDHPVLVEVDAEQIRMALKNVIANAVQAMKGSGALNFSVRRANNGFVELAVADTGPGIPPENIDKIFDPLFTTKAQGIGFGLSLAKMIVENHGGTIRAESPSDGGAAIIISLPAAEQPS